MDFKYHLLTLTAVFLALALGVFIGTALPGTELVWGQQQSVIADLQSTFTELKNEASAREAELALLKQQKLAAEELARTLLPHLIKGRLAGKKVGLLLSGVAAAPELAEVLTMAGAEIVWEYYWETNGEPLADERSGRNLGLYLTGLSQVTPWDGCSLPDEAPAAVDAVALVGSWNRRSAAAVTGLAQALQEAGVLVAGVQTGAGQDLNDCLSFAECAISSVDSMESPTALAALVAILSGAEGQYGTTRAAKDGYLPQAVLEWSKGE